MSLGRPQPRRVALFAPNGSALYGSVLHGLRNEFEARGINAFVSLGYYKADQMAQFCDLFKPDIVLEMDRLKGECRGLPETVKHIAWVQDWRTVQSPDNASYKPTRSLDSDMVLFSNDPRLIGFDPGSANFTYFLNATSPDVFWPEDSKRESDVSLVGYIPHADGQSLEDASVSLDMSQIAEGSESIQVGSIGELVDTLAGQNMTWNTYHVPTAHKAMNSYLANSVRAEAERLEAENPGFNAVDVAAKIEAYPYVLIKGKDLFDVENVVMRIRSRREVVDSILSTTESLRLFGIGEWQFYPQYSPYYCGCAMTDSDVRRIFRSSAINLHNSMGQMHPRVLDCMASGSLIFVNAIHTDSPDAPENLSGLFEKGEHYIEYTPDTLVELTREYLADDEKRMKIGKAARDRVLDGHTWSHRVDQFLSIAADI